MTIGIKLLGFELREKRGLRKRWTPRRTSILLIGGDKTGNRRFYERYVTMADSLYDEHVEELRKEGLI